MNLPYFLLIQCIASKFLASNLDYSKIVSLYTIGLLLDLTLNEISVFHEAKLSLYKK